MNGSHSHKFQRALAGYLCVVGIISIVVINHAVHQKQQLSSTTSTFLSVSTKPIRPGTPHKFTTLPGLPPNEHAPSMYTGYINLDGTRNIFYWLVENSRHPHQLPLLVWLQGGPGCSSLYGLILENGPIWPVPDKQSSTGWSIAWRPDFMAWHNMSNILYIDSPVGVGFSYGTTDGDYQRNDNNTVADLISFMEKWYNLFPSYKNSKLWLTGESYAGQYVSNFAYTSLVSQAPNSVMNKQLTGLILGNPVLSCNRWKLSQYSLQLELLFWKNLISLSTFQAWQKSSCYFSIHQISDIPKSVHTTPPQHCVDWYNKIVAEMGEYDPNNLFSDPFTGNASLDFAQHNNKLDIPIQDWIETYFNRANVRAALGVHTDSGAEGMNKKWVGCCAEEGQDGTPCKLSYTNNWTDTSPFFNMFFSLPQTKRLQILIVSGDTDILEVPTIYSQMCLQEFGQKLLRKWSPWTYQNSISAKGKKPTMGYVEAYDTYTFSTIRGAGHVVGLYSPTPFKHVVANFLHGTFP